MSLCKLTKAFLSAANAPLQSVAMDLLSPFLKSPRLNAHILVIIDRYTKPKKALTLVKADAYFIAGE